MHTHPCVAGTKTDNVPAVDMKRTNDNNQAAGGAPKPRVLVLAVKRSLTDRGFLASLHLCGRTAGATGSGSGARDAAAAGPAAAGGGGGGAAAAAAGGALEIRKSYPLKNLHDFGLQRAPGGALSTAGGAAPPAAVSAGGGGASLARAPSGDLGGATGGDGGGGGVGSAAVVTLRLAQHHSVPEHAGRYVFASAQDAFFFLSLSVQLLRCGIWRGRTRATMAAAADGMGSPTSSRMHRERLDCTDRSALIAMDA